MPVDLSATYPPLMSTEQVMAALAWGRTRVVTARTEGHLPARRVGKNWVFMRSGVEAFLNGTSPATQDA